MKLSWTGYRLFSYTCVTMLLLLGGCARDEDRIERLPESVLVDLYADKLIIEEEEHLSGMDSLSLQRRIDSLYTAYGVSERLVDATIRHYKTDLPRWRKFWESVSEKLEFIQRKESTQKDV